MHEIKPSDEPHRDGFWLPGNPIIWCAGAALVLLIALPGWVVALFVGVVGGWFLRKFVVGRKHQ